MNPVRRVIDRITGREHAREVAAVVVRQTVVHDRAIREKNDAVDELHRLMKVARGAR